MSNGDSNQRTGGGWEQRIEQDAERLRTGSDPTLLRIRELVASQGVDIGTSLVANLMPEDTSVLSGFIVETGGRVHEFEYDWRQMPSDQGQLAVWRDITDSYESRAFRDPISVAVALSRRPAPTAVF